jgi:hypothetical protein
MTTVTPSTVTAEFERVTATVPPRVSTLAVAGTSAARTFEAST